jgi:hypothetical protein
VRNSKDRGLNELKNSGTYHRDTETTEPFLCALCVSVVKFQVIKSSFLSEPEAVVQKPSRNLRGCSPVQMNVRGMEMGKVPAFRDGRYRI